MGREKIDVDAYDKIKSIIKSLYTCTDKEQVEQIFIQNGVKKAEEKIKLLRECMEIEAVYGTPENISPEDDYEFECAVFVEGTWRMLN